MSRTWGGEHSLSLRWGLPHGEEHAQTWGEEYALNLRVDVGNVPKLEVGSTLSLHRLNLRRGTHLRLEVGNMQGSHSTMKTMKTMKMELNHENHEKNMKIRIRPKKTWKQRFLVKIFQKFSPAAGNFSLTTFRTELSGQTLKTEISGQNFPKIFACGEQFSLIIFVVNFGDASQRQSSIWTKNSLNCVQKTMKTMNLREKITMKTMKMGKNNHENHEKLLKNGWEAW